MTLILIIFCIWFVSAVIRTIRGGKTAKAEQPEAEEIQPEECDIEEEKRRSNLLYSIQQAEADIINDQERLNRFTSELSAMDEDVKRLDTDIEFYRRANQFDSEVKARKEKERIQNRIFSFEEKVRACEKRIGKAQHTKEMAERELTA